MQSNREYFCLEPANFRLDGGAMFGIIPKPLWNKVHPSDEQNRIDLALRLLLIKTKNKLILIDTGIGDFNGEKFDSRFDVRGDLKPLEKSLEVLGFTTDDVTDLILSHLHFDHVGGIGEMIDGEMKPIFKKAMCHVHTDHYEYAHNSSERDAGSFHCQNFDPVINWYKAQNQMVWHSGSEGTIIDLEDDPIKFKCSNGHTPFLMHPFDSKFIYLADLIPTSNHVHIPWVMGYDINPGTTTKDKREFLDFIVKNNLKIIYEHDPKFWGGEVELTDRGPRPKNQFEMKEGLAYKIEL